MGAGVLSEDISRNLVNEVSGPIVLQIQKIKNVATPSTKQYDPSPSKRLLKLQLTDGRVHAYVTAVEFDGAINNVRYVWRPCRLIVVFLGGWFVHALL